MDAGCWTLCPSTSTPSVACTNSSLTPTCSVPSRLWPSCYDALFLSLFLCLYLGLSTPLSLAVSSYPFLPRSPHVFLCFHWAAPLSPCNLSPWQSHLWGTLDLRLLFGANTCVLLLWCQVSVWLSLGCQGILFCLSESIHALLQG